MISKKYTILSLTVSHTCIQSTNKFQLIFVLSFPKVSVLISHPTVVVPSFTKTLYRLSGIQYTFYNSEELNCYNIYIWFDTSPSCNIEWDFFDFRSSRDYYSCINARYV